MTLLTILVPTRNRRHRLEPLVCSLLSNLPPEYRSRIEILVLNNKSEDDTNECLRKFSDPMIRVINNDVYFRTSEENVINGVKHARGDFIWFLGDDDVPRFRALHSLIDQIEKDDIDFFVSNCRVRDEYGRIVNTSQMRGVSRDHDRSLLSLIKRVGMINMLAGFSVVVARRSLLDVRLAKEIVSVSPIYSHCFWFMACFANKRVRLFSQPLVDYRVFFQAKGWSAFTEENNVGHFHYWHLALLDLFRWAVSYEVLSPLDISEIFEFRNDGSRYRLIDEVLHKFIEQTDYYVKTGKPRNLITRAQFEDAKFFIFQIDAGLQDILFEIERVMKPFWPEDSREISSENSKDIVYSMDTYPIARARAMNMLVSRNADLFGPYLVRTSHGFYIYYIDPNWIGVRCDKVSMTESVLTQLEPRSIYPGVIVRSTEEELLSSIRTAPAQPEHLSSVPITYGAPAPPTKRDNPSEEEARCLRAALDELRPSFRHQLLLASDPPYDARRDDEPIMTFLRAAWLPYAARQNLAQPVSLIAGWNEPEGAGTWSLWDGASLAVRLPWEAKRLLLRFVAFAPPNEMRAFKIRAGSFFEVEFEMAFDGRLTVTIEIPEGLRDFSIFIEHQPAGTLQHHYAISDDRYLGLFLTRIMAETAS